LATLVLVALTLSATETASAETLFEATLDQSQNVPPTGSPGTGSATLILNDAQTQVDYVITYTGLIGAETDAHFHRGAPGETGSPIFFLPLGTPKFGTWDISAHDVADLFAGMIYVNIHTTAFPGGEIRGDISESSAGIEGERSISWGRIKALY
jgi:hypothetical protein